MNLTSFVSSSHIFLSIYGFVISNISHQKKPSIPMLLALLWSFPLHSSSQPSQRPISNFRSITTVSPPGNSLALQFIFFCLLQSTKGYVLHDMFKCLNTDSSFPSQQDSTQFSFTTHAHSRFQICDQFISFLFPATIMAGSTPKVGLLSARVVISDHH